jgi:hypothetical protein
VAEIARQHGSEVSLDDAREPGQIGPGTGPGALFTLRLARVQPVLAVSSPDSLVVPDSAAQTADAVSSA